MGHSDCGDITSKYIGSYPPHKMLEYNSYLLKVLDFDGEESAADQKDKLLKILKDMSDRS